MPLLRLPVFMAAFAALSAFAPARADLPLIDIASFTGHGAGSNGAVPLSGVTLDASGNIFGTTYYGGPNDAGVVYEIASGSGVITDLAAFTGTNGRYPHAGVTLDGNGNIYGTTYEGGVSSAGVVYEIVNGSHIVTDLASFSGYGTGTNGAAPYAAVTLDSHGNLFGTASHGGAYNTGTVYEIAHGSGIITNLASFSSGPTSASGADPTTSVTIDTSGNLFGTTQQGGAYKAGTVYEIVKGSGVITPLASFGGYGAGTNGAAPYGDLTLDADGNLFGTTELGGVFGGGVVYEIAKGTTTIVDIASFNGPDVGTNGGDPVAGITFDGWGNIFGTAQAGGANGFGAVYEIVKASSTITDLYSFDGSGIGTSGAYPSAPVTFDASGNLFGTTQSGGAYGAGTVFEIEGAGTPAPEPSPFLALVLGMCALATLVLHRRTP